MSSGRPGMITTHFQSFWPSKVIGLIDAAGTERARYTYDPYGAHDTSTALNGTLPTNPYRYASGRVIATNATNNVLLYQYGERFYNPPTGRWTQQDNLEHPGDPAQGNRYAMPPVIRRTTLILRARTWTPAHSQSVGW